MASRGRLLDLMNVKYLVATTWNRGAERLAAHPERFRRVFSDASIRVFENLSMLPRAFLVPAGGAVVLAGDSAQLARVRADDFDPATTVVVPEPLSVPDGGNTGETPVAGVVGGITSGLNEIRMTVAAPQPGIVVLSQTWYPGWRAGGRKAAAAPARGLRLRRDGRRTRLPFRSFRLRARVAAARGRAHHSRPASLRGTDGARR